MVTVTNRFTLLGKGISLVLVGAWLMPVRTSLADSHSPRANRRVPWDGILRSHTLHESSSSHRSGFRLLILPHSTEETPT